MAFDKKFLLATTFIAGFAVMAPTAMAQEADQPAAQQEEQEDDVTDVGAVVITGSRIRRNEFTSSAPIQVITGEEATLEGLVDTAELLQQSSIASGSFQLNNQLTGFVTEGGGNINSVSLRGLGAQRTLVLLNGRRVGPAGTRGQVQAVDLNVIPQSLIERVEILKDGASSIYGSDAIAGVINIITRTNLDGLEASTYFNRSFDGGGDTQRHNIGWGTTFDRGYIQAGFDYYRQDPLRRGDRDDIGCASDLLFDPTSGELLDDRLISQFTGERVCFNLFAQALRANAGNGTMDFVYRRPGINYDLPGNNSLVGGMARQGRPGFPGTYSYYEGYHPFYDRATILSPVDRWSVTVNGGFDLTPNTELYGELLLNRRISEQDGVRQFFPTVSAFIPGAMRPDTGTPFVGSTILPIIPKTSDTDQSIDYYRLVGGLRGNFGGAGFLSGWDWDIYAQIARSDGDYQTDSIYADRVAAVTGVNVPVTVLTGTAPCYEGPLITNLSNYSCSALPGGIDWTSERILRGDFNQAERDFLFLTQQGNTVYDHQYIEGSMAGDLFELPAGTIGAAVGFQIRREEIDDTPDEASQEGNLWGQTAAGRTTGSDTVREVFGELEIPLVRGFTGIDELTLNVSGRYSDYDSYGSSDTYKVGLNWQITPAWRVRLTQGTSFRAPALYELFLANQTGFGSQLSIDPCIVAPGETLTDPELITNCAADGVPVDYTGGGTSSATIITGGGFGILEAETAEARTLGLIWTPAFIDLSVAVDYFEIEVENEITQFGAANIVNQCYQSVDFPNSPFCTLFGRSGSPRPQPTPPTPIGGSSGPNAIDWVNNSYVNVANQVNRGIDLTVRYGHEFAFGDLTLSGQFTWQLEDQTQLFEGFAPNDVNGSTTEPDFTGQFNIRFDRGDWTAFWGIDMFAKTSDTELFGGDTSTSTRYSSTCRVGPAAAPTFLGACTDPTIFNPVTNEFIVAGVAVVPVPVYFKQWTEFQTYHDFSLRYRMDDWTFQAGIQNVFDERPPSQSTGQFRIGTAALNLYDVVGRRGFVQISRRF